MKKVKLAVLFVGVLVLAGCGKQAAVNDQGTKEIPKEVAKTEVATEASKEIVKEVAPQAEEQKGGIINSIKDAMGLGKTMKCTYKIKTGESELEMISYVNGKKYMTEMTIANMKQKMVFDETAMYSWTEGQKQGIKMTMACAEDMAKNAPQSGNAPKAPDVTGEDTFKNALDVKCVPATETVDFSIPTGMTFNDQCEMLKNIMKNAPVNIPNPPAGQ